MRSGPAAAGRRAGTEMVARTGVLARRGIVRSPDGRASHRYAVPLGQPLETLELVGVDVHGEPFFSSHCTLLQSAAVLTVR